MIYSPRTFLLLLMAQAFLCLLVRASEWKMVEIKIPLLNSTTLNLLQTDLKELFQKLQNRRVIFLLGEYKVGKTLLIDLVTNTKSPKSHPLDNTLGLHIYYDDDFVIVDPEGLNQFGGKNDPYFVRHFMLTFMQLTADHVIVVNDQMKVTDKALYDEVAHAYYTSAISDMTCIHNLKTCPVEILPTYVQRMAEALKLSTVQRRLVDKRNMKQITHYFYPQIEVPESSNTTDSNLIHKIISRAASTVGDAVKVVTSLFQGNPNVTIEAPNFFGGSTTQRLNFTEFAYAEAVDQSLRYLGYRIDRREESTMFLQSIENLNVEFTPPRTHFCLHDQRTMAIQLRAGTVFNATRVTAETVKIVYQFYGLNYQRFVRQQLIHPPVPVGDQKTEKWKIYHHEDGIATILAPITPDQNTPNAKALKPCVSTVYGKDVSSVFQDPEVTVNWKDNLDFILEAINVMSNVKGLLV